MAKTVSSTTIGVALLSLLLPLSGCSGAPRTLYGKTIEGQVIDAQSSQPIAGAHVMYLWYSASLSGSVFGGPSQDICYHAAAAVTDAQGRFHIAAWEKPQPYAVPNREPMGWAYARGYVPAHMFLPAREPTVHPNDVFRLLPSQANGDQRLQEIASVIRGCSYGGLSQRSLYPALKAAYEEAKGIAVPDNQKETVHIFARVVAGAWIAPAPVGPADEQQIDRFIRENLQ